MDIYVLNGDLQAVGIIDAYKSMIWATRYWTVGDCEIYASATAENLQMLVCGNFLVRADSRMICRIVKIELDTSAEDGDYIVATGVDAKGILDQRVVWQTMTAKGNAETFIRGMVTAAVGADASAERKIKDSDGNLLFALQTAKGFTAVLSEQVSYKNVGEKIREYCRKFGWGYEVTFDGSHLAFGVYAGTDRSASVIFSDRFENLSSSVYVDDRTNIGNLAVIAGEGEGSERVRVNAGEAEGIDRYEIYVDARDLSAHITFSELKEIYPLIADGGDGYIEDAEYKMQTLDIQVLDDVQLSALETEYPDGEQVTIDGVLYYRVEDAAVADLPSANPDDEDTVVLKDVIYTLYLLTRGYTRLSEYGAVQTFNGTVEPFASFRFGEDYFLGDIVTVQNEYGITAQARITEVVEVNDESGYNIEPKFEYITEE